MKRLLILLSLLAAIGVQAQGVLKGTVTDAKTGEPLPFVYVTVFKDGTQVHGGTTDFDGIFVIKPLDADTYDIEINYAGYIRYRRDGVQVKGMGFTVIDVQLNPISVPMEPVEIVLENYGSQDGAMLAPLTEYTIVSHELKRLLDRVIDGKEHTYEEIDAVFKSRPLPRGATCNLYLFRTPAIDTTWDSVRREYNYLYLLFRFDSTLPYPLKEKAPAFSFDSATLCLQVTTTFYPDAFSHAEGFVRYRGRIFFLAYPVEDSGLLKRRTGKGKLFKYRKLPAFVHRDLPTWIYTEQQGYWYRWMEFPNGF